MDFLKVKKFRKAQKPEPGKDLEDKPVPQPEEPKNENGATEGVGGGDNDLSSTNFSTPSPKSASKKLSSPLRCLSLKKIEEPDEETENLQQPINDPYQDIETAYVAQICLTWEALHCQYSQLSQIVLCQPENPTCYNHSAQHLQQFQVLLQRFIENEPFQDGLRAEIYARARNILPKLLQIPNIQGSNQKEKVEEESDYLVHAPDIIRLIESSILTFQLFVKADKKKHSSVLNLFGNQNLMATPLQQVQSLLEKKGMKLKELRKKRKGWKKKSWPQTREDVPLFILFLIASFASFDVPVTDPSRSISEKTRYPDRSNQIGDRGVVTFSW
ncbi:Ribosomal protein L34Ae [Corchorus olitorius]|uniref:Ribosomal protein L34Ae n=1 Tax=Corchorus olitorius TaxID=93759 RepID=A0A1R3H5E3_9ROSI|nr:Ribosomal protein L34Ae [Corchorus olitorius]